MVDHTGSQLGKYKLLERLGRGGMAEVYKAYQPGLERPVAVKIMYPHLAETPGFVDRFQREAQAIARLHHPHIVQVYDYSSEGDLHYMVMEFVEGQTLKVRLDQAFARGKHLPLAEVVGLFQAVLAAVDYAHNHNVVHRDLKPGNLLIEKGGRPVLSDFGIAKIVGTGRSTTSGQSVGTPAYMSPEQGQGESGDRRSDIYALGIMLYECLTGQVPYDGDTSVTIMLKHINAPIPSLRQARPDLSPALEAVVTKTLAKSPGDRFHTAAEMWTALRAAVEGSGVPVAGSPPVRPPVGASKPGRTRPAWFRRPVWIVLAAVLLIAVSAGAFAFALLPAFNGPSPAEQAASQGQSLLAEGKYQLALDSFTTALQSDPHNVAALLGHAHAEEALAAPDQALADISQVVTLAPQNADGYSERARLGLQYGLATDMTAVQADLDRAVALAPQAARSYFVRGWANLNFPLAGDAPDPALALPDLQEAVALDLQDGEAQLTLAQALQALNRPTDAVAPASRAAELSPRDPLPHGLRARLLFQLGDFHGAIDDLNTAINLETDPTELARLLAERGYLNFRLATPQAKAEAQRDLTAALGQDPTAALPKYLQLLLNPSLPRPTARQIVQTPDDAIWQAIAADLLKKP